MSGRASERRYRKSEIGRRNNARRQRRHRERNRRRIETVTQQGPPAAPVVVEPVARQTASHHEHDRFLRASERTLLHPQTTCCFCGAPCSAYGRNGFLRRRGAARTWP